MKKQNVYILKLLNQIYIQIKLLLERGHEQINNSKSINKLYAPSNIKSILFTKNVKNNEKTVLFCRIM